VLATSSADEDESLTLPWSDLKKEETLAQAAVRIAQDQACITFEPRGIVCVENYPSLKQQFFRCVTTNDTPSPPLYPSTV
jgi:hypothetical protein